MLDFLVKVSLISASGALAPGPLTTATLAVGTKNGWKGGFKIALGHTLVEFPLVVVIALGLYALFSDPTFVRISSLVGGVFMLFFGYLTIRDVRSEIKTDSKFNGYPLMVGIALTALNPFFVLWWVGIGSPLILHSILTWGLIGLIPFYLAHVWLDYAWLMALAHATSLGGKFERLYRAILFTLGVVLMAFGVDFISYALFNFKFL